MKPIVPVLLFLTLPLFLTACFESKDEISENAPVNTVTTPTPGQTVEDTPQAVQERARISKLDTLSKENIATQVEAKSGKKVLKDRRLFVNYLRSAQVKNTKMLIDKLADVENAAKDNGIELSDADINVIITGSEIENPSWSVCGDFNATKQSLDAKNKYYGYINALCNPQASQKTDTTKK